VNDLPKTPADPASAELESIRSEVKDAIALRSNDWLKLQERIRARFIEYRDIGALRGAIYNVYSREDRQPPNVANRHLKGAAKIADEILVNRRGGTKSRTGQERKIEPNPKFDIYDVSDIIGVTIVCPFESDVTRVVGQIKRDCERGTFSQIEKIKEHDRKDYQAVHLSLRIPEGALQELQCEAQVKTAVQDAFGWKTHDLAYKPEADTDPWFVEQFTRVSQILRAADSFSDQLRARLERERSVSLETRRSVQADLLLVLREVIDDIVDEKKRSELEAATKELRDYIASPPESRKNADLKRIEQHVEKIWKDYGCDANSLRLAVLCAAAPGSDGYIHTVRRHYEEWIRDVPAGQKNSPERLKESIHFADIIAIAYFCLNDIESAIQLARQAAKQAGELAPAELGNLHVNLSFYHAEAFAETRDRAHADLAQAHADQARTILGANLTAPDHDSLGYVRIVTGTSIQDVEGGLDECRAAYAQLQSDPNAGQLLNLATKFFEMHRELAYKRLSQMAAERGRQSQPGPAAP
jgi:ppGpp synthetase/RelA/SpoT-type nucleotidyltranferase